MARRKIKDSHAVQWQDYDRRKLVCLIVFLTLIPAAITFSALARSINVQSDNVELIVFLVWGAGYLASSYYLSSWRCPRCWNSFCWKWGTSNPFARRCVHYGLRKGSTANE